MGFTSIIRFTWTNPSNKGRRFQKMLHALEWQLYKRTIKQPRVIRLANGVRFKAYPDCVISSAVQYADWPEYHELHFCRRMLRTGDAVIDVGANVGHFSLLLGDLVAPGNIFCFEPTPVTWGRLRENFTLNGWPTDHLQNAAVGARPGKAYVPNTREPVTTNRLVPKQSASTIEISVVALDQFADRFVPGSIGLLKIDVEGHEAAVFQGGQTFLKKLKPRLIMFECLSTHLDPSISEPLRACGYSVYELGPDGNPRATSTTAAQNLFAIPVHTCTTTPAARA